jgi:hypothetical protein
MAANRSDEKVDPVITAYTLMPAAQVRLELEKYGVDPQRTIEAVKTLVLQLQNSGRAGRRK